MIFIERDKIKLKGEIMIVEKLIRHQTCDMGKDYREYEITEDMTLNQVLEWIKENITAFGTITIRFKNGDILRKFDYNLYHKNERSFYYSFGGWESEKIVNKMISQACFMNCDFEIQLR